MDDAILHGKPFGIPLVYLDSSYIRVFFPGKIVKSTVLGMRFPEVFFLGGGGGGGGDFQNPEDYKAYENHCILKLVFMSFHVLHICVF